MCPPYARRQSPYPSSATRSPRQCISSRFPYALFGQGGFAHKPPSGADFLCRRCTFCAECAILEVAPTRRTDAPAGVNEAPGVDGVKTNALYYGDNLAMLREYIPDESVDLVYLDPPFNSNRDYNVIFKDESGRHADAQIVAFEDTWHWGPKAEASLAYLTTTTRHRGAVPSSVSSLIDALVSGVGKNQMMAYIVEMSVRLVELHRVIKPTGSLYLHCDPTASHYLKIILDSVFGPFNFRNDIIWKRTYAHGSSKKFGPVHDDILFYSKSDNYTWNQIVQAYDKEYLEDKYKYNDSRGIYRLMVLTAPGLRHGDSGREWRGYNPSAAGRHWAVPVVLVEQVLGTQLPTEMTTQQKLDLLDGAGYVYLAPRGRGGGVGVPQVKQYLGRGVPLQDVVTDISPINSQAQERLGWPTQKPLALLNRIISASSNPDDVILDPFCGCGTAVVAAHNLGRRWVGIDITYLAISVMCRRLTESFGLSSIDVINRPTEIGWAHEAVKTAEGRYEFQWWALDLVGATPLGGGKKKGADRGIDGVITFPDRLGKMETVVVSVKGGANINSGMVRDLVGVVQREKAAVGLFVMLENPTREMRLEAAKAGFFTDAGGRDYPKIQILTIDELLNQGRAPSLPAYVLPPYPRASRIPVAVGVEQQTFLDASGQPIPDADRRPVVRKPEDTAPVIMGMMSVCS